MVENANGLAQKVSQAMIAKGNAAYAKTTPNTPAPVASTVAKPHFNAAFRDRAAPAEGKREPGYIANLDAFIGLPKAETN